MSLEGRADELIGSIGDAIDGPYNEEWPGILKVIYAITVILPAAVLVLLLIAAVGLAMLLAWAFLPKDKYREYISCQK